MKILASFYTPPPLLLVMALIALLGLSSACATPEPYERALRRSQDLVSSGVRAGLHASDTADSLQIQARYNPCRCEAPDFELRLRGRWQRHLLNGDPALLEELEQAAQQSHEAGDSLRFWYLQGTFRGTRRDPSGIEYPLFRLESFSD